MRHATMMVLFFSLTVLAINSNAGTIPKFDPALLVGDQAVYEYTAKVTHVNNRISVHDWETGILFGSGEVVTPQEMIHRFQQRNPQAKIVGVDLDSSGSHYRHFHIYYIVEVR